MLDMNDTGMKMITSEKVVAITARPMSAVAARAAANGDIPFSSTNRKMFSSTTIASSITIPTIRTRASIVTVLSVKWSAHIMPKVETTDEGGQNASEDQVHVDLVQSGVYVAGLVLDLSEVNLCRQLPGGRRDASLG